MDCDAKRDSACIFVLSVSNGCDASGDTSPNAMPLSEPYRVSSIVEPWPTVRPLALSDMAATVDEANGLCRRHYP